MAFPPQVQSCVAPPQYRDGRSRGKQRSGLAIDGLVTPSYASSNAYGWQQYRSWCRSRIRHGLVGPRSGCERSAKSRCIDAHRAPSCVILRKWTVHPGSQRQKTGPNDLAVYVGS